MKGCVTHPNTVVVDTDMHACQTLRRNNGLNASVYINLKVAITIIQQLLHELF